MILNTIIRNTYIGAHDRTISLVGEYGIPNTTKLNEVISIYVAVVANIVIM
jgi:hypothetical protein